MTAVNQHDLLNSWKEIAAYLNRGVRTVQRWEAELGLPVRRPRGMSRSAVIAMRSEIDAWLKTCPVTEHAGSPPAKVIQVVQRPSPPIGSLIIRSHELQHSVSRTREELGDSLSRLMNTLEKMVGKKPAPSL
ncbi:MAG: hypothetical protein DMG65_06770 [Candidatus Angelobacter sp. Gp1-AA117]|nr:MAG: hypothetical protein DMG65_06770 [Candidatus Angelobacter sp. Gp1-AA117]